MNIKMLKAALVGLVLSVSSFANAGLIAIINGSSLTSETDTTNSITTQLTTLHEATGNTVSVFDLLPVDLSLYNQVWDIRFSNASALTTSEQTDYLSYLQSGGGMFLMGENHNFSTRNNSIFSFIDSAGGGDLAFAGVSSTQTVNAPFNGPNAVTSVNFSSPGGADGKGTGDWITNSGTVGSGIGWGAGDLLNASAGALSVIFDVNFMQTSASLNQQNLTKNLIGFIEEEVRWPY